MFLSMMFRYVGASALFAGLLLAGSVVGEDGEKKSTEQEYKSTPFGKVAKKKTPPPAPAVKKKSNVRVSVEGDSITFSRPTPFGAQRWTSKRAELNVHEKQWLADHEASSAKSAARPALEPEKKPKD